MKLFHFKAEMHRKFMFENSGCNPIRKCPLLAHLLFFFFKKGPSFMKSALKGLVFFSCNSGGTILLCFLGPTCYVQFIEPGRNCYVQGVDRIRPISMFRPYFFFWKCRVYQYVGKRKRNRLASLCCYLVYFFICRNKKKSAGSERGSTWIEHVTLRSDTLPAELSPSIFKSTFHFSLYGILFNLASVN